MDNWHHSQATKERRDGARGTRGRPGGAFEGDRAQRGSKSPEERQRRVGEDGGSRQERSGFETPDEGLSAVPTTLSRSAAERPSVARIRRNKVPAPLMPFSSLPHVWSVSGGLRDHLLADQGNPRFHLPWAHPLFTWYQGCWVGPWPRITAVRARLAGSRLNEVVSPWSQHGAKPR